MKKLLVIIGFLSIFLTGCVVHDRHYGYRDGYRHSGPKYERKYNHSSRHKHYRPRAYNKKSAHRQYRGHRSHHRKPGHHRRR